MNGDPAEPSYEDPVVGEPLIVPPAASEQAAASLGGTETPPETSPATPPETSPAPIPTEQLEDSEQGSGSTVKAAAVLAGTVALAKKAAKKVQEIREKRAAGRRVILTEFGGRSVAIGPYGDDEAALQDTSKMAGAPRVVELLSGKAFFEPADSE